MHCLQWHVRLVLTSLYKPEHVSAKLYVLLSLQALHDHVNACSGCVWQFCLPHVQQRHDLAEILAMTCRVLPAGTLRGTQQPSGSLQMLAWSSCLHRYGPLHAYGLLWD